MNWNKKKSECSKCPNLGFWWVSPPHTHTHTIQWLFCVLGNIRHVRKGVEGLAELTCKLLPTWHQHDSYIPSQKCYTIPNPYPAISGQWLVQNAEEGQTCTHPFQVLGRSRHSPARFWSGPKKGHARGWGKCFVISPVCTGRPEPSLPPTTDEGEGRAIPQISCKKTCREDESCIVTWSWEVEGSFWSL